MYRIIRELKPSYVLCENVVGLLTMEDGGIFEQICVDLENKGYTVESFIIPAAGVGAWHRRDRVFIIGYSKSKRRQCGEPREPRECSQCETGILGRDSSGRLITNSDKERLQGSKTTGNNGSNRKKSDDKQFGFSNRNGQRREVKPKFRGVASRISTRLDGCIWDREHPEPTKTKTTGRAERLKQLGNAVVPQVVFEIFKAIEAYENI